jgi:hypothetical protein
MCFICCIEGVDQRWTSTRDCEELNSATVEELEDVSFEDIEFLNIVVNAAIDRFSRIDQKGHRLDFLEISDCT